MTRKRKFHRDIRERNTDTIRHELHHVQRRNRSQSIQQRIQRIAPLRI